MDPYGAPARRLESGVLLPSQSFEQCLLALGIEYPEREADHEQDDPSGKERTVQREDDPLMPADMRMMRRHFEAASGGAEIFSSTARVTSSTVKRFMQARSS